VLSNVETEDHEATRLGTVQFRQGDTLMVHSPWDSLARLLSDRDFVVVTTDFPREELRPHKVNWALTFFAIALILILFSDIRLSLCLLIGAVGMILSRVLSVDEAYEAVSWSTCKNRMLGRGVMDWPRAMRCRAMMGVWPGGARFVLPLGQPRGTEGTWTIKTPIQVLWNGLLYSSAWVYYLRYDLEYSQRPDNSAAFGGAGCGSHVSIFQSPLGGLVCLDAVCQRLNHRLV